MKILLGKILEHFEVVSVKDELLYLGHLNRWFKKSRYYRNKNWAKYMSNPPSTSSRTDCLGTSIVEAILYPSNEDHFDDED